MTTPADKRAEQYRQIHGLVRLLGMNDEAYRDMLRDRYQVESSKQLSTQQRSSLIRSLREQVHGKVQKFNELSGRAKHKASPAQLRAIEAMWAQVSRAETSEDRRKALNAFCKRLTGVEVVTWICKDDAKVLIKAIHAMGAQSPEEFNRNKNNNQR
ncbi:MAG: regulatory protein GemA [Fibrobacter sp.]|uniref:regulatory protein GemA n=1 Tax=Fibrobacter sp. TaxID=35828 RepID=UPI0025BD62F5|nr:regulatory protein GemA [Fibrobacter sp.]MBS7271634.1 regulatory protein GemA [Fibrobacter sp.]